MNKTDIVYHLYQLIDKFDALLKIAGDRIVVPGFKGYSLYYIGSFFIRGLMKGSFAIRAKSVTYSLFSSIFPALIFGFSLIPFIPIDGFQQDLLQLISSTLPPAIHDVFFDTISDTILNPSGSLLSFGALLMLFFSSNGILSIIDAFNATYHHIDTRNILSKRLISILLVIIISTLTFMDLTLMIGGSKIINYVVLNFGYFVQHYNWVVCLEIAKWLLIVLLYFFAISFLYFLAPSKKSRFKFISPGALLATIVQIVCTSGFSYYVTNFANYNKLYGSIGTIIIVLMLLYFTSISLILGFELNISILSGKEDNKPNRILGFINPE